MGPRDDVYMSRRDDDASPRDDDVIPSDDVRPRDDVGTIPRDDFNISPSMTTWVPGMMST